MNKPHWQQKHQWLLEDIKTELEEAWEFKQMLVRHRKDSLTKTLKKTLNKLKISLDYKIVEYIKAYGVKPNIIKMRREVEQYDQVFTNNKIINNLTIYEIVDAFPLECKTILPREFRKLKKDLQPYFNHMIEIREDYPDDFERNYITSLMEYEYKSFMEEEIKLYDRLLKIKKLYNYRQQCKIKGIPARNIDIEKAKSQPIEGLYHFKKQYTTRNRISALCPFHGEKTGSFIIYIDQNKYHCFGCGIGGDAIDFIMRLNNLTFIDAVRYLGG